MTSEAEIQETILEVIYDSSDSLISSFLSRNGVVRDVLDEYEDLDEPTAEYHLTILEEDGLIKRDKGTIQMGWRGLEKYEELGGSTHLNDEIQENILNILLKEKKEDPKHPYVSKEELISEIELDEEIVTENVWIQREVGNVELRQAIGSDYIAVAITKSGRRALETVESNETVGQDSTDIEEIIEQEVQKRLQDDSDRESTSEKSEEDSSEVEDAFICHASEDKEDFVEPLAQELQEMDLEIWYDEFKLEVGDSIRREVERGLANSRYGIVIISENFFDKEWPQRELDVLAGKEIDDEKVILPVWLNVDREFVEEYSPALATKYAIRASRDEVLDVAEELYGAVSE